MTRRDFFKASPLAVLPCIKHQDPGSDPIKGVGVLRYPHCYLHEVRKVAENLCSEIRQGTIIALPNDVDEHGNYCWDFRIESGDPQQVKVERQDDKPDMSACRRAVCTVDGTIIEGPDHGEAEITFGNGTVVLLPGQRIKVVQDGEKYRVTYLDGWMK